MTKNYSKIEIIITQNNVVNVDKQLKQVFTVKLISLLR